VNEERGRRRILVVSDGKRGHINQSLAVARRLGDPVVLEVRFSRWKAVFVNGLVVGTYPFGKVGIRLVSGVAGAPLAEARKTGASAVVSAGQTVSGCALLIKRMLGIPGVVLMKPTAMPLGAFDVVVAPAHDFPPGKVLPPNVVAVPVALSEPLAGSVKPAAEETGAAVAFLVGGDTRGMNLNAQDIVEVARYLLRWASLKGARVLVTTSRRTPAALSTTLKAVLREQPSLTEAVFADETDANPVADYLVRARHIIVTDDSFSMVSEAVLSGRVPFILETGIQRKFQRSYEELVKRGWARIGNLTGLKEYLEADPGGGGAHHIIEEAVGRIKSKLGWA